MTLSCTLTFRGGLAAILTSPSRMGRRGKREFVQVLRLMETFSIEEVHQAVRDAIRLGALSFDAVKHLVLCGIEGRPPGLGPGAVSIPAQGEREHYFRDRLHDASVREGIVNDRPTILLETPPQGAQATDLPQGVREDGCAVCR